MGTINNLLNTSLTSPFGTTGSTATSSSSLPYLQYLTNSVTDSTGALNQYDSGALGTAQAFNAGGNVETSNSPFYLIEQQTQAQQSLNTQQAQQASQANLTGLAESASSPLLQTGQPAPKQIQQQQTQQTQGTSSFFNPLQAPVASPAPQAPAVQAPKAPTTASEDKSNGLLNAQSQPLNNIGDNVLGSLGQIAGGVISSLFSGGINPVQAQQAA